MRDMIFKMKMSTKFNFDASIIAKVTLTWHVKGSCNMIHRFHFPTSFQKNLSFVQKYVNIQCISYDQVMIYTDKGEINVKISKQYFYHVLVMLLSYVIRIAFLCTHTMIFESYILLKYYLHKSFVLNKFVW